MNDFFLNQLKYNYEIMLKNISDTYDIDYKLLKRKYYPKKLYKCYMNLIKDKEIVTVEDYFYIDYNNNNYIVINDSNSKYNAILINKI